MQALNARGDMALDQDNKTGTVGKAVGLLDLVAEMKRPVRFNEILAQTDMPKATAYRLLQTLTGEGLLEYNAENQVYSPGLRLVRLAHSAWSQASLARIAQPIIDELSRQTGETVHLAQLDHGQVLYLDKRKASQPIPMFAEAGKVGPAYCTGIGKAILAFLPETSVAAVISQQSFHRFTEHTLVSEKALRRELKDIRKARIAYDREEHEEGIICIAAPILTANGQVLGGLSITSSTRRYGLNDFAKAFERATKKAAKDISRAAELWHFPERATQL